MSFADLRQTVLQSGALSTAFFGEDVDLQVGGAPAKEVRCKITHSQASNARGPKVTDDGSVDEFERIQVLVSRSPSAEKSLPQKPSVGTRLFRKPERDADRRPFAFAGEVQFEGDQHAVYIFQRPRRVAQGGR